MIQIDMIHLLLVLLPALALAASLVGLFMVAD
jgi:hypothetical protein